MTDDDVTERRAQEGQRGFADLSGGREVWQREWPSEFLLQL